MSPTLYGKVNRASLVTVLNYLCVVICRSAAVAFTSADQFSRLSLSANCHASNLFSIAGVIIGLQIVIDGENMCIVTSAPNERTLWTLLQSP